MTDMRHGRLPQGAPADHSIWTLSVCVAHCPPPPVARKLSNPSWKVIVSASHGQYLKPGSDEPGFFRTRDSLLRRDNSHHSERCPGHAAPPESVIRSVRLVVPRMQRAALAAWCAADPGSTCRHALMGPGSAEQRDRTMRSLSSGAHSRDPLASPGNAARRPGHENSLG